MGSVHSPLLTTKLLLECVISQLLRFVYYKYFLREVVVGGGGYYPSTDSSTNTLLQLYSGYYNAFLMTPTFAKARWGNDQLHVMKIPECDGQCVQMLAYYSS